MKKTLATSLRKFLPPPKFVFVHSCVFLHLAKSRTETTHLKLHQVKNEEAEGFTKISNLNERK